MGELLDALNAAGTGGAAPDDPKSTFGQTAEVIQNASRRVGEAVDAARQPDMPLDILTKLVRQVPLQSLAIAFVLGLVLARRR
jgi:hypothetical protein